MRGTPFSNLGLGAAMRPAGSLTARTTALEGTRTLGAGSLPIEARYLAASQCLHYPQAAGRLSRSFASLPLGLLFPASLDLLAASLSPSTRQRLALLRRRETRTVNVLASHCRVPGDQRTPRGVVEGE
jgi:hypothetical protein